MRSTNANSAKVWMPLYVGDYLADTCRLTTEQHGAYFLLILDYWRNGALPDDDSILASVCRLSANAWSMHSPVLRRFFTKAEDGLLHHERLDAEIAKAQINVEVSAKRAKKAAKARWSDNAPSNAPSIPHALLEQCPSPSPSPSPLKTKTTEHPEGSSAGIFEANKQPSRQSHNSADVDRVYQAYPLKKGAGAARKAINRALVRVKTRGECEPATFLVDRIAHWIRSRERNLAAHMFVPPYPHPATWFNEERYDDDNNPTGCMVVSAPRYVNPAEAYSGAEYSTEVA